MNNSTTGTVALTASASTGLAQWLTQNATLISMGFMAASFVVGLIFSYRNYKINQRRLEMQESQFNKTA